MAVNSIGAGVNMELSKTIGFIGAFGAARAMSSVFNETRMNFVVKMMRSAIKSVSEEMFGMPYLP